jgi:predicted HTH transcriptional regulator
MGKREWRRQIKSGECLTVEFKRQAPKLDRLSKTVSAFSNSSGGTVFFGVDDEGEICGLDHVDGTLDLLKRVVQFHCDPPATCHTHLWEPAPGCKVLIAEIKESEDKPVYAVSAHGQRDAWPYFRSDKENLPLDKKSLKIMRHGESTPVAESEIKSLDRHTIHILNQLDQSPRCTLNQLAKSANISAHRAKKLIVQLERKGWIHGHFNEKRREYSLVIPWKKR